MRQPSLDHPRSAVRARRLRRAVAWLGVAALFAVLLVSLRDAWRGPEAGAAQPASAIAWQACDDGFECATLAVPLDHAQPAGRQIELALIRLPAREPRERIGPLLVNPGGPGGSALQFMRNAARGFPDDLRDRFDIVGFDPRGVGESTPLLCHDDLLRIVALDPAPVTPEAWASVEAGMRGLADLCASRGGELLPRLGSVDVVSDMERIREALGEQQITYLGYSYGTVLGALYADRYPQRVRAMVLDGPMDLTASGDELVRQQALGFDDAFARFAADCRRTSCSLARDGRDPGAAFDELVARARRQPVAARSANRAASAGDVYIGVIGALYNTRTWPSLATAVNAALEGDASNIVRLADRYLGRTGDGYDNSNEMNAAVNCVDGRYPRDAAGYRTLADRLEAEAPRFGRTIAIGGLVCAFWRAPVNAVPDVRAAAAPPLLVIGTTHDPATPFAGALAMRRRLATAVLLTHDDDGHTAYGGDRCVDPVVDRYLLTLALPEDGAICGDDATPRPAPTSPAVRLDVAPSDASATPRAVPGPAATGDASERDAAPARLLRHPAFRAAAVLLLLVVAVALVRARRDRGARTP